MVSVVEFRSLSSKMTRTISVHLWQVVASGRICSPLHDRMSTNFTGPNASEIINEVHSDGPLLAFPFLSIKLWFHPANDATSATSVDEHLWITATQHTKRRIAVSLKSYLAKHNVSSCSRTLRSQPPWLMCAEEKQFRPLFLSCPLSSTRKVSGFNRSDRSSRCSSVFGLSGLQALHVIHVPSSHPI